MVTITNPALAMPCAVSSFAVGKKTSMFSRQYNIPGSRMPTSGVVFLKHRLTKPGYMQPFSVRLRVASSDEASSETSNQFEESIEKLKAKWETLEDKSAIAAYSASAIVFAWISSTVIGAISPIPLLPKLMELVGLGYSSWFVYRYLLFKENRDELNAKISDLKQKMIGTTDDQEKS